MQSRAYTAWNHKTATSWLRALQQSDKRLNSEQEAFMRRIIDRCQQEARDLTGSFKNSEPLRDCLLGFPGTGKSTCINTVRDFFEKVLHWEKGVQFQFLASQNTMAALVDGQNCAFMGRYSSGFGDGFPEVCF